MELASGRRFAEATQIHAQPALGQVLSVSNGACHCRLSGDMQAARDTAHVGAHLKIPVDGRWLVAMVYAVRPADGRSLDLEAGFLGEAEADAQGGLQSFVRGISRYPAPDEPIYAVSREELALVYGAGRAKTIDVGAVHPTHDVRARLKIDSLLAKHFAILGSSGTGKSTTTALVLHRLLDQLPHAHILMLDPHGEYKRAFGARGHALDVSTLELPYWTMNLQEHCEVLVSRDDDSPVQADILARCLLTARSKAAPRWMPAGLWSTRRCPI
ncbi:ATP-binding protein [Hankyongella ginsenosidimutans]|uniref:ATP-binding protein n=1 Tax=Hankyongella ginsenosidimutans TaxID=1763828 RepID=UPI002482D6C4|nr:ATP-binding protein [Hankyongella ginsenosidimutans]